LRGAFVLRYEAQRNKGNDQAFCSVFMALFTVLVANQMYQAWSNGRVGQSSLQSMWTNLNHVASSLKDWSRATFGSVRKKIRQLEGKLRDIRENGLSIDSVK
jgi:hypothetical protein